MRISVVMPAYNEESGIAEFIAELDKHLKEWNPVFFVVDDCSKDQTANVAQSLVEQGVEIRVVSNEVNSGHGPSTVRALHLGLSIDPEIIVAIDGDGQFTGSDVAKVVNKFIASDWDIAEGVRTQRDDPIYRKLVTSTTRMLVFLRCYKLPRDANTPLRIYSPLALRRILQVVGPNTMIPNLKISSVTRRWKMNVHQVPVSSIPRRGVDQSSVTWGNSRRQVPTRRFLKFCFHALKDFWSENHVS
jgi:glycosyltransferase involved in cell wall biosynthesis